MQDSAEVISPCVEDDAQAPSPAESLRLVQAFLAVRDPAERAEIIDYVERLASRRLPKRR